MFEFTGDHNRKNVGQVTRAVQVFLSKTRSWHGENVVIAVRTERIKDTTAVKLQIRQRGAELPIAEIEGKQITASKLDETYKIDWKAKDLTGTAEFLVKVEVDDKLESKDSLPLLVDLDPPLFSA